MRVVLSEAAEEAVARVMTTLSLGVTIGHRPGQPRGRMEGTRGVLLADPRHSMVLPHLTAIAEEFSHRTLVLCSLPLMDFDKAMHRELWSDASLKAEGSWGRHREAWFKWHGIQLTTAPDFPKFNAYIDARNAIMHGLGELTRMQTRKDGGKAVIQKLKSVGISMHGLRLVIAPSVLKECAHTARRFIEWLDTEVAKHNLLAA